MAFDNDTNRGRVQKMLEMLALIRKSAESNNAGEDEMIAMLQPLLDEIGGLGAGGDPVGSSHRASQVKDLTAGERAALHLADQASLRDLIAALMGRLDAHAAMLDG